MSHSVLKNKLYHFGVRGLPLQLFLTTRIQITELYFNFVNIITICSSYEEVVVQGVPQGSILSPLCFCYTADMPRVKGTRIVSNAHDTSVAICGLHERSLCDNIVSVCG